MRWLACLGVLAAFLHLSLVEAHACTMGSTIPSPGALANPQRELLDTAVSPRNVAFLAYGPEAAATLDVARAADGTIVQARLSRRLPIGPTHSIFLYTLDAPLPAGARFVSLLGGPAFETEAEVLDSAPLPTELRAAEVRHSEGNDGCLRRDSCGSITTLDLDHPEESSAAFYGVYYGDSPEEVAEATEPTALALSSYLFVDEALRRGDRFVAVTVFDRAGHESAKSQTVRIANEGAARPHAPPACSRATG